MVGWDTRAVMSLVKGPISNTREVERRIQCQPWRFQCQRISKRLLAIDKVNGKFVPDVSLRRPSFRFTAARLSTALPTQRSNTCFHFGRRALIVKV